MKFHHVGIACKNLEETKEWVKSTHSIKEEIGPVFDELQNASFITLKTEDDFFIELIEGEQVAAFLKKGMSLYHVCYAVDDLDAAINNFKKAGAIVISKAKPAVLFNNRRIVFLNTPMGIVELLEEEKNNER